MKTLNYQLKHTGIFLYNLIWYINFISRKCSYYHSFSPRQGEIIPKFAVDYLENCCPLWMAGVTGLWWHLVTGGAAWTWSANQRPVSGASYKSEAGAVGSAQFICVMILKQNLSVRALLSLCHPGLTVCKSEMAEERISKLSYHKPSIRDGPDLIVKADAQSDFWDPCFAPWVSDKPCVTNLSRPERCLSWGALCACFENFTNR